jgi:hypothetical protein
MWLSKQQLVVRFWRDKLRSLKYGQSIDVWTFGDRAALMLKPSPTRNLALSSGCVW